MALFYFLRHGETEWNAEGRLCGRTDVPLSSVGRRQAQLLGERLKGLAVEALYSSPLQRAIETAREVGRAIGHEPIVDARLTELSYGAWEGHPWEECQRATPDLYRAWVADPATVSTPEGESGLQVIERVTPFLTDVSQKYPSGNVVVVCHRTVCRLLACHLMGIPLAEYRQRIRMENAALNVFACEKGIWRVVTVNDTSHLAPAVGS